MHFKHVSGSMCWARAQTPQCNIGLRLGTVKAQSKPIRFHPYWGFILVIRGPFGWRESRRKQEKLGDSPPFLCLVFAKQSGPHFFFHFPSQVKFVSPIREQEPWFPFLQPWPSLSFFSPHTFSLKITKQEAKESFNKRIPTQRESPIKLLLIQIQPREVHSCGWKGR